MLNAPERPATARPILINSPVFSVIMPGPPAALDASRWLWRPHRRTKKKTRIKCTRTARPNPAGSDNSSDIENRQIGTSPALGASPRNTRVECFRIPLPGTAVSDGLSHILKMVMSCRRRPSAPRPAHPNGAGGSLSRPTDGY